MPLLEVDYYQNVGIKVTSVIQLNIWHFFPLWVFYCLTSMYNKIEKVYSLLENKTEQIYIEYQ